MSYNLLIKLKITDNDNLVLNYPLCFADKATFEDVNELIDLIMMCTQNVISNQRAFRANFDTTFNGTFSASLCSDHVLIEDGNDFLSISIKNECISLNYSNFNDIKFTKRNFTIDTTGLNSHFDRLFDMRLKLER